MPLASLEDAEFVSTVVSFRSRINTVVGRQLTDIVKSRMQLQKFIADNPEKYARTFGVDGTDIAHVALEDEIADLKVLEEQLSTSGQSTVTVADIEARVTEDRL